MRRASTAISVVATCLFAVGSLAAQLASDVVPRQRLVPRREQVRRELESSRYRLGPFRLQPLFRVTNLGYNDNVYGSSENAVSDWTATAAAGLHWTLPFGAKTYFRGDVLPEYTWYANLAERRVLGGTYGASYVALFERVQFEAAVEKSKGLRVVSSELEAVAEQDARDASFDVELELTPAISMFGSARARSLVLDSADAASGTQLALVENLDRDDAAVRAGLRYKLTSFFDVTLAGERTQSEFDRRPQFRDNETTAILLGVHYDRPRFYVNLMGGRRQARPLDGSSFPAFEANTGSWFSSYELAAPVAVETYGHRRVSFGVQEANPYFLETRAGGALVAALGQRVTVRMFADSGTNDYQTPAHASGIARSDDVLTYGGGFSFRVHRGISAVIAASQAEYDSNVDAFDRSVVRLQTSIVISGDSTP